VGYLAASVLLIKKSCLDQSAGVLGNSFKIAAELIGNLLYRNPWILVDGKQNGNPP